MAKDFSHLDLFQGPALPSINQFLQTNLVCRACVRVWQGRKGWNAGPQSRGDQGHTARVAPLYLMSPQMPGRLDRPDQYPRFLGCLWQLRKLLLSLCKHLFMSNLTFDTSAHAGRRTRTSRRRPGQLRRRWARQGPARNMSNGRWAWTCPCYTWLSRRWVRRNAF